MMWRRASELGSIARSPARWSPCTGPNVTPCLAEAGASRAGVGARGPDDIEKAIDYSTRAGNAAVAVFAYEEATAYFRGAVEPDRKQGGNRSFRRAELFDPSACIRNWNPVDRVASMRRNEERPGRST